MRELGWLWLARTSADPILACRIVGHLTKAGYSDEEYVLTSSLFARAGH